MVKPAHCLDPQADSLLRERFGIQLGSLHTATTAELAAIADEAARSKEFLKVLPVLKEHLSDILEAQAGYEKFTAEVQRAGLQVAAIGDRLKTETQKAAQGYALSVERQERRRIANAQLLHADHETQVRLDQMDLQAAVELLRFKADQKSAAIQKKLPQTRQNAAMLTARSEAERERLDAIRYGTGGHPTRPQGGGWLGKLLGGR